ncbi:MAG: hypothetical protein PHU42_00380 [Patescibacteria group bacterium]|nr:hypothetical protein [Patescibacteria group bacterium]
MLPNIVTTSQLRQNLSAFLTLAGNNLVIVKSKESNKVIMDEKEYNRLSSLANQFINEDPEGKYRPSFEKEILKRSRDGDIDKRVKSLKALCTK